MRLFKAELRAEVPAAEALLADRQEAQRALALMQRLPARERVVLSMALVDDKSQREIAQALALSEGYVSKLLERGKARVRRLGWEVSDERA